MKLSLPKECYETEGAREELLEASTGIQSLDGLIAETNTRRGTLRREYSNQPFAKLINLQRRARRLRLDELAERAGVDLIKLFHIEHSEMFVPEPYTVLKLAEALQLPGDKLLQIAGLTLSPDNRIQEEAILFAARSERIDTLTNEESEALQEFVSFLSGK